MSAQPGSANKLAVPAFLQWLATAFGAVAVDALVNSQNGKLATAAVAALFIFCVRPHMEPVSAELGTEVAR